MATARQILDVAARDLGYTESPPGSNSTKYGRWYGLDNQPWCMMAVQYWFMRAGSSDLIPRTASCTELMQAARRLRQWVTSGFQPGDVVLFDFSGKKKITQHVGLVERVEGGYAATIEGNTSSGVSGSQDNGGGVFRRKRSLAYITGAFRPRYQEDYEMEINDLIEKATDEQMQKLFERMQAALGKKTLAPGSKLEAELKQAKLAGITDGNNPYQLATRAQAAVMAFRAR